MPLRNFNPSEQVEFLRLVMNSTSDGFYSVNTEGVTTLCNASFLKMLGYDSADDVIGRKLHDEIHHTHPDGSHYDVTDCPIFLAAKTGKAATVTGELFFRKDGTSFPVDYRVEPLIADGVLKGAVCTFTDITQRKQDEEKVKTAQTESLRSAEQIELALDSGTILGTWVWDIVNDKVTGDNRFARTFSVDPEDVKTGLPINILLQSIHPEDVERVGAKITEVLATGGRFAAEYRLKTATEDWLWIEASGRCEFENGKAVRFPGVIIDISERREAEEELLKAHDQLRLAQQAGGIGVFNLDILKNRMSISPEFCKIFGIPLTVEVDPSFIEKLAVEDSDHATSNAESRSSGTSPLQVEYRIKKYDTGELRWIARRGEFVRDYTGNPVQMTGIVQDITERRKAESDLREREAQFRLLTQAMPNQVWTALPSGHLDWMNNMILDYSGLAFEEVAGEKWAKIVHPDDLPEASRAWAHSIETGVDYETKFRILRNDGAWRWHLVRAIPFRIEDQILKWFGTNTDIDDQIAATEAIREARNVAEAANIAKTEFLANMSHEIRTPMNAVMGLSNILAMSEPLTQRQSDFIKTLRTSADSLLVLINDLLDIAKIEANTVQLERIPFSLTQIMQEIASMMGVRVKEKGLTFTGEGECVEHRMFVGDPNRLRQIILNLCSNAVKFTDHGGVHVSVGCAATDNPNVENICISVKDTGIGIASEKINTIFDKFVQADSSINRKYGGTGLGLTITKTLVETMGGTVSVESSLGKGSTFTVCIPLEIAAHMQPLVDKTIPQVIEEVFAEESNCVLLVEDYEPNVIVATTFLEMFGYSWKHAANGFDAVEMIKSGDYIAVLMDVQMHGMNGLEATKIIRDYEAREGKRKIPIIGMTAHALQGDRERCIASGMDDYIAKPFNPEELREILKMNRLEL